MVLVSGSTNAGRMLAVHSTNRDNGDSRALVHDADYRPGDECWAIETVQSGEYILTKSKVR